MAFWFSSQWRVNMHAVTKYVLDFNKKTKEKQLNSSHQTCLFYCQQVYTRENVCDFYLDEHYHPTQKHDTFYALLHTIEPNIL